MTLPTVAFSVTEGEVLHSEAEPWARFVRMIRRRARVVEVDAWGDRAGADLIIVGAPRSRVGPERVQALRRWVRRGGRCLVLGTAGGDHRGSLEAVSDHGLILQGLLLPDVSVQEEVDAGEAFGAPVRLSWRGGAFVLTPRAALENPEPGFAGAVWPQGRGWFRFGRPLDLHRALPLSDEAVPDRRAWGMVSLRLRRGLLSGLAGAEVLDDTALGDPDHVRFAADLLDHLLPDPEERALQRLDPGGPEPFEDRRIKRILRDLNGDGLDPRFYEHTHGVHPVEQFAPAFRTLGSHKLARFYGERVVLTDLGRQRAADVRSVFTWRHRVLAQDLLDTDVDASQ